MGKTLRQRKRIPAYDMGVVGGKFDPFVESENPDDLHRRRYSHEEDYSIDYGNIRTKVTDPGEYDDQENDYSTLDKAEYGLIHREKI